MTEREVLVRSDAGVHARPAMMFVREAMKYPCEVFLIKDNVEANGKSIMSVLGLAITSGSRLIVRAGGTRRRAPSRSSFPLSKRFQELERWKRKNLLKYRITIFRSPCVIPPLKIAAIALAAAILVIWTAEAAPAQARFPQKPPQGRPSRKAGSMMSSITTTSSFMKKRDPIFAACFPGMSPAGSVLLGAVRKGYGLSRHRIFDRYRRALLFHEFRFLGRW